MANGYVESIGVELEGFSRRAPTAIMKQMKNIVKYPERIDGYKDCSLEPDSYRDRDYEWHYWSKRNSDVADWIKHMFTDFGYYSNDTCGFHIHMKMDEKYYNLIMTKKFCTEFKDAYVKKFGKNKKYMARLHNSYSSFDSNGWHGDAICVYKIFDDLGTVEFRIFPHQDNPKEAERTIKWARKTVNNILERLDSKRMEKIMRREIGIARRRFMYGSGYSLAKYKCR